MKIVQRQVGIALLLALLTLSITSLAQDNESFTLTGSRPVVDLLNAIVDSSELEINIESSVTGSTDGFSTFCQNESDITTATRPLSIDEEASCIQNEVQYAEYLIGYDVLAVIAHPDYAFNTCLTGENLKALFAPSAQSVNNDWANIFANPEGETETEVESTPLTLYLPANNTSTYAQLDALVDGVGLRSDALTDDNIVTMVEQTPGAVGVVSLSAIADANVTVLELQNDELRACFLPSVETIESRQYLAVNRLFVYVNQDAAESLGDLLALISDEATAETVTQAGFTPISSNMYTLNQAVLAGEEEAGRLFSTEVTAFEIPTNVFGTINIGGTSSLNNLIATGANAFSSEYPGVTITAELQGETLGQRQLCNGEISILAATGELSEETLQNCEANNVTTHSIKLGDKAAVLVANGDTSHLECLTTEQVVATWSSSTAETMQNWQDVDAAFPESKIILVAPPFGRSEYENILLSTGSGPVVPVRQDVAESNRDPLYRAAAVANVDGALTFMSWQDYQSVLGNNQANIQLVAINGGDDCITPSLETIASGEYPYAHSYSLIVNQASLSESAVQSFLWYLFSDENFMLFSITDMIAPSFGELPEIRENLQATYAEALAATLEAAETTPEATAEATAEAEATEESSN